MGVISMSGFFKSVFMLLCVTLVLTACGGGGNEQNNNNTPNNPPNNPPPPKNIGIQSNSSGTYTGTTDLTFTVDTTGLAISRVELSQNNTVVSTLNSPPYQFVFPASQLSNGSFDYHATAFDANNNSFVSTTLTITINIPPAQICTPGSTINVDCTSQVANALNANITQTCNSAGTGFDSSACTVVSCNTGFTPSNNQCIMNAPPMICTPGTTNNVDCTSQIANALNATITQTCNSTGTGFNSSACTVTSCNTGFTLSNNQCVQNTPPMICTPGATNNVDCTSQIANAASASITQTCNSTGTGFNSSVCTASACNTGFTLSNNVCVQNSTPGQWPFNDPAYPSQTGFNLEVISEDIAKAYPGMEYDYRLAVRGGAYPYQFRLNQAPTGMLIHNRKGILKWQAPQTPGLHDVQVEIKDSTGAILQHNFQINVTTSGFYFISPNGNDNNDGSINNPIQTIDGLGLKRYPADSIVYFHGGDYVLTKTVQMNTGGFPKYWMAVPGELPRVDCGDRAYCIGNFKDFESGYLFKGFEFHNTSFKYFSIGGTKIEKIRWRKNLFRDLVVTSLSNAYENPSFIFFWDIGGFTRDRNTVLAGSTQYKNMVIQENEFTQIANYPGKQHASSSVWYDVHFSMFEDNLVHDVTDGYGFNDKDDSYFNTIRGNVFYDIKGTKAVNGQTVNSLSYGLQLGCQYACSDIEVNHNLFVGDGFNGAIATAIGMSGSGSVTNNVYVHHNTFIHAINYLGYSLGASTTDNIVYQYNLIQNIKRPFYSVYDSYDLNDSRNYVRYVINPPDIRTTMQNNYLWTDTANLGNAIVWAWGGRSYTLSEFIQNTGHESNSIAAQQNLSSDGTYSLSPTDQYFGIYGKDYAPGAFQ